jgi:hypothetical protein
MRVDWDRKTRIHLWNRQGDPTQLVFEWVPRRAERIFELAVAKLAADTTAEENAHHAKALRELLG